MLGRRRLLLSGGKGGGAPPVFDPATLALTLWQRASFTGSPWVGTASAGTSGANGAAEATNPPAAGTAVNGLTPADFDGTNDLLVLDGADISTYYATAAYSGWALIKANVVNTNTDDVSPFANDAFLATTPSGYWNGSLRESGAVQISHFTITAERKVVSTPFAVGQWQLVQWKYDGTNVKVRVNNGAWVSLAAANQDLQNVVRMGSNYQTDALFDGDILDLGLANTAISDGDFDNILAYCESRYGVDLQVFDPATLSLTGWWRGPFRQSPWVGQISAGGSGGRDLTEATNPPAVGAAVNGIAPADFDGANDRIDSGAGSDDLFSNAAGSIAVLFNADSAAAPAASAFDDEQIVGETAGGRYGIVITTSGVRAFGFDGATKTTAHVACATGGWHVAFMWWDLNTLSVQVDSGTVETVALGGAGFVLATSPFRIGANYGAGAFFDGRVVECLTLQATFSAGNRTDIKSYLNARYGLSL